MRRGNVVTVADRSGEFTGKPRPALIIQNDVFRDTANVTICPITSVKADSPLFRIELTAGDQLPLRYASWVQVDKVTTVSRHRIGARIGRASDADMGRINAALATFLGIAS